LVQGLEIFCGLLPIKRTRQIPDTDPQWLFS